ncbi:hypothetical protein [Frondihabitans cladoniiphilus]|uniref:Uncharacterized protein n=1 Tax=Frondihabitans cladoniiphilus TaxID=715785 RepID=A0ABP8W556_9MICO
MNTKRYIPTALAAVLLAAVALPATAGAASAATPDRTPQTPQIKTVQGVRSGTVANGEVTLEQSDLMYIGDSRGSGFQKLNVVVRDENDRQICSSADFSNPLGQYRWFCETTPGTLALGDHTLTATAYDSNDQASDVSLPVVVHVVKPGGGPVVAPPATVDPGFAVGYDDPNFTAPILTAEDREGESTLHIQGLAGTTYKVIDPKGYYVAEGRLDEAGLASEVVTTSGKGKYVVQLQDDRGHIQQSNITFGQELPPEQALEELKLSAEERAGESVLHIQGTASYAYDVLDSRGYYVAHGTTDEKGAATEVIKTDRKQEYLVLMNGGPTGQIQARIVLGSDPVVAELEPLELSAEERPGESVLHVKGTASHEYDVLDSRGYYVAHGTTDEKGAATEVIKTDRKQEYLVLMNGGPTGQIQAKIVLGSDPVVAELEPLELSAEERPGESVLHVKGTASYAYDVLDSRGYYVAHGTTDEKGAATEVIKTDRKQEYLVLMNGGPTGQIQAKIVLGQDAPPLEAPTLTADDRDGESTLHIQGAPSAHYKVIDPDGAYAAEGDLDENGRASEVFATTDTEKWIVQLSNQFGHIVQTDISFGKPAAALTAPIVTAEQEDGIATLFNLHIQGGASTKFEVVDWRNQVVAKGKTDSQGLGRTTVLTNGVAHEYRVKMTNSQGSVETTITFG